MQFETIPHPSPTPDTEREVRIADPGFGKVFTDHMVTIDYDEAKGGWHSARIGPREAIALDPAASVLHYAQEIFEGMKAFRHEDGGLALFRPQENARRFNASARRMAMPEIPEELFLEAVRLAVKTDRTEHLVDLIRMIKEGKIEPQIHQMLSLDHAPAAQLLPHG